MHQFRYCPKFHFILITNICSKKCSQKSRFLLHIFKTFLLFSLFLACAFFLSLCQSLSFSLCLSCTFLFCLSAANKRKNAAVRFFSFYPVLNNLCFAWNVHGTLLHEQQISLYKYTKYSNSKSKLICAALISVKEFHFLVCA